MASITERDTRKGTSLTLDRAGFGRSSATRSFFVEAAGGDRDDLQSGIEECLADGTIVQHPDLGILAKKFHATHHSDNKVNVRVRYSSRSTNPNTAFTHISARMGYIAAPEPKTANTAAEDPDGHNEDGNPQGDPIVFELADGGAIQVAGTRTIPVWHLTVSTVLTFPPYANIGRYTSQRVNDNAITWDGFPIKKNACRFDGADVEYRGDKFYYTVYHFTIRNSAWLVSRKVQNEVTGEITSVNDYTYLEGNFTNPGFIVAP